MAKTGGNAALPRASVRETAAVISGVFMPSVVKGAIIRRPRMVGMAEKLGLDSRAVRRMQQLRNRYGSGPLMLRVPGREQAIILDPEHVRQVLDDTPEPFATASSEKRAALSHFEPKGALISDGAEREDRRRFNEQVLESGNPMHRHGERFQTVVREETEALLSGLQSSGRALDWDRFSERWFRIVRRVVFGDSAGDDTELRDMINDLRSDANWAFLRPKRDRLRERFFERMNAYLARAEPGTLASMVAATPKTSLTAPDHQVPQWLFAFDPAGMATFRALALLATHPEEAKQAHTEALAGGESHLAPLPRLRATLLESLRLWPTTPMVLRQTTRETEWERGIMPAGTGVLIFAPFFHRDDERLSYAHRFSAAVWLKDGLQEQGAPPPEWPLIPFSGGTGICPGRNLVLLLTSHTMAAILRAGRLRLLNGDRLNPKKLPGTLNNYSLRFQIEV
jgi:cytochrome P450